MTSSVIIPTYNGAKKIPLLLDALLKQTFSDFEVIIVVDGSTDNTLEIINGYTNKFNSIKIVSQQNAGRSKAKNNGAKEASGNLFVFYDDDMIPAHNSLKQHYEFHSQNLNSLLAGNPIENIETYKTDIQNYKAWLTKNWTAKYTQEISQLNADNLFFTAANCSMPRAAFELLNGFDERLTDAEDFDLAYRAIKKSISVYFDQSNVAIHNDPITCVSYIKRIRQYQQAQQILSELHPERNHTNEQKNFKHDIYRLFAHPFIPRMIDHSKLLNILPVKIRYRLYSIIIQSLAIEYPNVTL
jgi:glycosyltransferase involved in cell wall biosynthesis